MMKRNRDAEAELNLPPGFRFHPTDEELVAEYLCRKVTQQLLPVPIIAEIDLYKFDPWQLPEMALFGHKEWYFFTPRDRKYPNGSRPNRAAGSGYWKATGADKPVTPSGSGKPVGIKKALVFYAGKAPKGTKTNWIMHEYRLPNTSRTANKKGSLRLDDWVLCRLYNKKNNWENERRPETKQVSFMDATTDSFEAVEDAVSDSHRTPESDVDNDVYVEINGQQPVMYSQALRSNAAATTPMCNNRIKEDNDWFTELNLDDLQNPFTTFTPAPPTTMDMNSYQDYYLAGLPSPALPRLPSQLSMLPF